MTGPGNQGGHEEPVIRDNRRVDPTTGAVREPGNAGGPSGPGTPGGPGSRPAPPAASGPSGSSGSGSSQEEEIVDAEIVDEAEKK